ncbi:hypothetical protein KCU91_g12565, partial [Aureobasidium melanogenum]
MASMEVASNPIVDLGEDDEPDMVRAMIKFMYGGRYIDYSRLPGESVVEAMVEMFVLADNHDVERLRVSVCNQFTRAMDVAFSMLARTSLTNTISSPQLSLGFADPLPFSSLTKRCNNPS